MQLTVAVIARECLPGRVKTRLCPPLTADQAADLAQISLSQTLETVRRFPVDQRLLVMDGTPREQDAAGFVVISQVDGGLDERLAAICDQSMGPLLILGMDTPQLNRNHLARLLHDWARPAPVHDAWLGRAADGGFWALAMREPRGALIRGVPMSTGTTGSAQLSRLTEAGLNVGILPQMSDVDSFTDAVSVAAQAPRTGFAASVHALLCELRPGSQP